MDQFLARGGGVAGFAFGEFGPGVEEAVAIDENVREGHAQRVGRDCGSVATILNFTSLKNL